MNNNNKPVTAEEILDKHLSAMIEKEPDEWWMTLEEIKEEKQYRILLAAMEDFAAASQPVSQPAPLIDHTPSTRIGGDSCIHSRAEQMRGDFEALKASEPAPPTDYKCDTCGYFIHVPPTTPNCLQCEHGQWQFIDYNKQQRKAQPAPDEDNTQPYFNPYVLEHQHSEWVKSVGPGRPIREFFQWLNDRIAPQAGREGEVGVFYCENACWEGYKGLPHEDKCKEQCDGCRNSFNRYRNEGNPSASFGLDASGNSNHDL